MLLTFVQLHILLVAVPAFANWVLLCPATLGNAPVVPAQHVYLVCQNVLEAAAPTTVERHTVTMRQTQPRLALCQRLTADGQSPVSDGAVFPTVSDTALLCSLAPFPHATRAP